MKAKSREITIAAPCNQDWEQMEKLEGKNFCNACQKCVIDFSAYTNEAILHTLTTSQTEICGRLSQKQLNALNYALIVAPPSRTWMKYLGVLAIGTSIFAQDVNAAMTKNNIELNDVSLTSADQKAAKVKLIYGYVLDENNKPLKGVKVAILNTKLVAITDEKGKYVIKVAPLINLKDRLLIVTTIHYGGEFKINSAQEKQANFVISKRTDIIMGLIAINPRS